MASEDRLRELEEKYDGFKVYDNNGGSIGKVDDLFVDDQDREEYIGVKMGLLGFSGTTLIPMEMVRVDEQNRTIEVSESKERVNDAPHYNDDDDIDHAFEERIRSHFGLSSGSGSTSSYGRPMDTTGAEGAAGGDNTMRGNEQGTPEDRSREPVGREEYRNDENYVSDSAMGAAAGGAAGSGGSSSGGVSDFNTGDQESRGEYRGGDREDDQQTDRQGGQSGGGMGAGASEGGQDERYREGYREGYLAAQREGGGQSASDSSQTSSSSGLTGSGEGQAGRPGDREGPSGSTGSGEGLGGRPGDREGASEYFGAPVAEPGEKEFEDMQDYQSATTGFQPSRSEDGGSGRGSESGQGSGSSQGSESGQGSGSGESSEGEGRMRVRRLRRGS